MLALILVAFLIVLFGRDLPDHTVYILLCIVGSFAWINVASSSIAFMEIVTLQTMIAWAVTDFLRRTLPERFAWQMGGKQFVFGMVTP